VQANSINGYNAAIQYSDPEIQGLVNIIDAMGAEAGIPESQQQEHVWLNPWDAADLPFYKKLFWVMKEVGLYHTFGVFGEEMYMPTKAEAHNSTMFNILALPAISDMNTAFPTFPAHLSTQDGSRVKMAGSGALNFPDEPLTAIPIDDSNGYPSASSEAYLNGNNNGYNNNGTEKSVQVHIYENEVGHVCLRRVHQVYQSEDYYHQIWKFHCSFVACEFVDTYDDYILTHTPMDIEPFLQNRPSPMTFKGNVRLKSSQDPNVASATPFCALLGVHVDGGNPDELSIADIVVSGHRAGWTNVAYSPGGQGLTEDDVGGWPIRMSEEIMTHIRTPKHGVVQDMAIGVLPTLPLGWVKSQVSRFSGGTTDVTLQEYNSFTPFTFKADLSNALDRYTAKAGTTAAGYVTDEGLVVTQADGQGVLDSGYLHLAGTIVKFGDTRWTIE
jgi:hypothetical protein